ncbi:MAG TPA: hypothetical protein VF808_04115 [Ktedonobacterales bacterium]
MRKHVGAIRVGGVVALVLMLLGAAPTVFAAPARASVTPTIHLAHHVILGESSIDGPALSSVLDNFEGVHFLTALAWTGTDSAHHLNVMQSADDPANGVTHFTNKRTLNETSPFRPAVKEFGGGLGATSLAWVGTDAAHTLNFVFDAYSPDVAKSKITLWGETSIGAPALTQFGNTLLLAWTGTDASHSLNVIPFNLSTQTFGSKTVLRAITSSAGLNLAVFDYTTGPTAVLSWTTSALALGYATSTDGVHFTPAIAGGPAPEFSTQASSVFYHRFDTGERAFRAWTGTDFAHHINIQWTTAFPDWPDAATSKYVLDQNALGGPQIALNDGYLIAWTGTNPAHSLNIATWDLY